MESTSPDAQLEMRVREEGGWLMRKDQKSWGFVGRRDIRYRCPTGKRILAPATEKRKILS